MVRWVLMLCLLLSSVRAEAQSATLSPHSGRLPGAVFMDTGNTTRFARAASYVGLISAGVLVAGSVAIVVVDQPESERITRGLHLGLTALGAPFVALGAYTARRRARVTGHEGVRKLGWTAYTGAIGIGVAQFYGAFHEGPRYAGLTVLGGVLAGISLAAHAFDAYVCARHARIASLQLSVTPLGVVGRF